MFDGRAYRFSTTHYDFGTRAGAAAGRKTGGTRVRIRGVLHCIFIKIQCALDFQSGPVCVSNRATDRGRAIARVSLARVDR
jgi:hypothetical protein